MIRISTLEQVTHIVLPCILNNLITAFILYRFMKIFLGFKPENKKASLVLYTIFFILANVLHFSKDLFILSIVPYPLDKYFHFSLYLLIFIMMISIAFCYKPTISTGLSAALLTALSLYCSIPISNYVFDTIYKFVVPNFDIFHDATPLRHIFYVIFEEYQQIFIYILQIIIKLLFLLAVLRVKHIYDERNMYYLQALRQEKNNLELKQFRHDIKNHMGALNQMLVSNNTDKALEYVAVMNNMTNSSQLFSRTGIVALDSIVNYKLSEAQKNGILCTYHAAIPEYLDIHDEDIIIIFGNLLDNAIEACLKLDGNRYIKLNLNYDRGLLFISVLNSFDGIIKKSGKKLPCTLTRRKVFFLKICQPPCGDCLLYFHCNKCFFFFKHYLPHLSLSRYAAIFGCLFRVNTPFLFPSTRFSPCFALYTKTVKICCSRIP